MATIKRPTVWVTNEPFERTEGGGMRSKFNLAPAAEFGELQVLIPAGHSLLSSVPTVRVIKEKLSDFTDDDYLLPVGDPAAMMIAGAIAAAVNSGRMKVLKWDRMSGRYIVIQIDITGKPV
jgi:hypothetical protein